MRAVHVFIVAAMLTVWPVSAGAEADRPRTFAWDVARAVLIDPTTFAPAVISYRAIKRDWTTSQVLFEHGWVEQNPRFTISGKPNDVPVSYGEGTKRVRVAALGVLQYSAANNAAVSVVERLLIARYPHHKTLIRRLSWVERIAFASILTYRNSAEHLRQASNNRRLAREYGYISP